LILVLPPENFLTLSVPLGPGDRPSSLLDRSSYLSRLRLHLGLALADLVQLRGLDLLGPLGT